MSRSDSMARFSESVPNDDVKTAEELAEIEEEKAEAKRKNIDE